jgi:hypothetical protein
VATVARSGCSAGLVAVAGGLARMKCGENTGYDPTATYCCHNWL